MVILRSSAFSAPDRKFGDIKESCQLLRKTLGGRKIAVITEERYLHNEKKLSARFAQMVGAGQEVIGYLDFLSDPGCLRSDLLLLRSSRIFTRSLPDVLQAIGLFREQNPGCVVLACVLDHRALLEISSRPGIVDILDPGIVTNDFELFHKGAEVLEGRQ